MGLHGRSRHEQVDRGRRSGDEPREVVVGNDSHHDESSNRHGEVVNDDGNHHDEGCNHELEVVRGRNSHLKVGSPLDEMVVEIVSGSDHYVGLRPGSMENERMLYNISQRTYVSFDTNVGAFEFLIVQFLDGNLQVTSGLEFHKAEGMLAMGCSTRVGSYPFPSRSRPTSE